MAFPAGWNRRSRLIISASIVPTSQTDFPVMLVWNGTGGNIPPEIYNASGSSPNSNGSDIRFTSDEMGYNELAFEIVTFVPNATVANARVKIWVKLPSLSSTSDTSFYMWWENNNATAYAVTDTYGRNNVWTNNYLGVFHLNEVSGTTATNSVGSNDGTYTGTTFPNRVDTTYGYMQSFVKANGNYVSIGTGSPWNITGNFSISALVTVTSFTTAWQAIIAKGDTTYRLARNNATNTPSVDRSISGGYTQATNTVEINTGYHHVAATFDTTVGTYCLVDGVIGSLDTNTSATTSTTDLLCIGRNTVEAARDWDGYIGEVTISNIARTPDWLVTEHESITNYATFVYYLAPTAPSFNVFPYCGWTRKCQLTQVGTQTSATVTGFPVPIVWNGTSGNIPAEVYNNSSTSPMSDGRDIRFSYDAAGTQQIPLEIVTFSPNSTVGSARVEIWIGLNVTSATNTTFYIWWGNSQAMAYDVTDPYGRNAVWTPGNFFAVYHMDGSGDVVDSTGGGRTMTNSGTTASSTALGTARNFIAANRDYLYNNTSYGTSTAVTYTALVEVDAVETGGGMVMSEGDHIGLMANGSGYPDGFYYNGSGWTDAIITTNIVGAGLRHLAYVCDPSSSIQRTLLNAGSEVNTTSATAIGYAGLGTTTTIGRHANAGTTWDFDGRIDEVWFSHVARSTGWVTNEYNSKVGFATFVTAGTAEDVEGVKYDNATVTSSAANPFSYNHTIGWGFNRLLTVGVATESASEITVAGVTYNGQAMTAVGSVTALSSGVYMIVSLYQLLGDGLPVPGTFPVTVTLSGTPTSGSVSGAISMWNVDLRGYSNVVTNTGFNGTVFSTNITPLAFNSTLVTCVGSNVQSSWSPTAPLVERYDLGALSLTASGCTMQGVNPVATTVTETVAATSARHAIVIASYPPHIYKKYGINELGINF
jgi:hypothetical protein